MKMAIPSVNQMNAMDPTNAMPFSSQLRMHQPGIEPGSVPWQGTILPLDHWCLLFNTYHCVF
ncbi:hypothetical protein N665_0371s0035 [Sinapis alba]|nr:hypothetical protein N665_0371s0035 [Sinapis alba]